MVTKTEARNFLEQVGAARRKSLRLSIDLAELKTTSKKLVATYQIQFGSTGKKYDTSDIIEKIEHKQEELKDAMNIWLEKRQKIAEFINSLLRRYS